MIGQGVAAGEPDRMRTHLAAQPEVDTVYSLITQQMGADVMVAVKAKMRSAESAAGLVAGINRVEHGFRVAFPDVRWLFFEPDLAD